MRNGLLRLVRLDVGSVGTHTRLAQQQDRGRYDEERDEQHQPCIVVAEHRRLPHHLPVEHPQRALRRGCRRNAVRDEIGGQAAEPLPHQRIAGIERVDQIHAMDLRARGHE